MAYQRSDPEVRAWMREHQEETKKIERLYNALKETQFGELAKVADKLGIDVEKYWQQFRERLITEIVKVSPDKALELVSGQMSLSETKQQG